MLSAGKDHTNLPDSAVSALSSDNYLSGYQIFKNILILEHKAAEYCAAFKMQLYWRAKSYNQMHSSCKRGMLHMLVNAHHCNLFCYILDLAYCVGFFVNRVS
jgi:hypothetical protein